MIIDGGTPTLRRAVRIRLSDECRKTSRLDLLAKLWAEDRAARMGFRWRMIAGAIHQHRMGAESGYSRPSPARSPMCGQYPKGVLNPTVRTLAKLMLATSKSTVTLGRLRTGRGLRARATESNVEGTPNKWYHTVVPVGLQTRRLYLELEQRVA